MAGTTRAWLAAVIFVIGILGVLMLHFSSVEFDGAGKAPLPPMLRVGVLPDESPQRLRQRYAPLLDHLAERLELTCELVIPASYNELLSLFVGGDIDVAYFGGYTYVKARQAAAAVPLVMRRIDVRFTSYFLVSANDASETLQEMRGKRLSFGSRLSTSGHLMPRFFLGQQNIEPETFFEGIEYSGAHDKTAYNVRDGVVDLGAANAATVRSMLEDGRLGEGDIRVLWETPPYADYVWAIQPRFDEDSRNRLRDAFLLLTPENNRHAAILAELNARGFIPADAGFFSDLEQIAAATDRLLASDSAQ